MVPRILVPAQVWAIVLFLSMAQGTWAWTYPSTRRNPSRSIELSGYTQERSSQRRALLVGSLSGLGVAWLPTISARADTAAEVRGIDVTPFNSLIFQYRGSDFGGLKASDINEPSVSYKEFIEKLKAGEVDLVEFMAPDGDAAYVTFKAKSGMGNEGPIRIGEGYPIEQHDGWSSPAFAVRAVKNAGVRYKFTVPGLQAFNK